MSYFTSFKSIVLEKNQYVLFILKIYKHCFKRFDLEPSPYEWSQKTSKYFC